MLKFARDRAAKGEKPCSDLSGKEERKEGNKEQKEEEKKPSSGLSKTIPRSYSTTLPGFNNVRRRSSDTYSDLLQNGETKEKTSNAIITDAFIVVDDMPSIINTIQHIQMGFLLIRGIIQTMHSSHYALIVIKEYMHGKR